MKIVSKLYISDPIKYTKRGKVRPQYSRSIYKEYLQTPEYKKIRRKLIKTKCEICGACDKLTLHHMDYGYLTQESEDNVATLCWICHQACHIYLHAKQPKRLHKPSKSANKLIDRIRKGKNPSLKYFYNIRSYVMA